ncbi:MAG: nucleotidyltransferase domain-containing protein [candidate division WOR-3 bacterium]
MGLFGSCVKGKLKKRSDIDIVVEFDINAFGENFKGLYDTFLNLHTYLEHLLNRKVDILTPISIETIRIKEVAEDIKRNIIYV